VPAARRRLLDLTQLGGWFADYNNQALHSALGMRSPADYRAEQLTLSSSR
jgi:hypothetical protein